MKKLLLIITLSSICYSAYGINVVNFLFPTMGTVNIDTAQQKATLVAIRWRRIQSETVFPKYSDQTITREIEKDLKKNELVDSKLFLMERERAMDKLTARRNAGLTIGATLGALGLGVLYKNRKKLHTASQFKKYLLVTPFVAAAACLGYAGVCETIKRFLPQLDYSGKTPQGPTTPPLLGQQQQTQQETPKYPKL